VSAPAVRYYLTESGRPLVYAGPPERVPVLTIENSPKWYGFHLVMPDGSLKVVHFGCLEEAAGERGVPPYVDHVPNPEVVPLVASRQGWILDSESYEMMVGRWECEVVHPEKYDY